MQTLKRDYEAFYSQGGWDYDPELERAFLKERLIDPLGLKPGAKLLDLGCGIGLFAGLFHDWGFDVVGADQSPAGIAHAKAHYPGPEFLQCDAAEVVERFAPGSFDVIFVRGMSWYHYELDGVNKHGIDVPAWTRRFFELLVPGGIFILQIKTDFTGTKPAEGVYHCKVSEFVALFAPLGEIVLLTDWAGTALETDEDGLRSGKKVIIATRRG